MPVDVSKPSPFSASLDASTYGSLSGVSRGLSPGDGNARPEHGWGALEARSGPPFMAGGRCLASSRNQERALRLAKAVRGTAQRRYVPFSLPVILTGQNTFPLSMSDNTILW